MCRVHGKIRTWQKLHESMDTAYQQEAVLTGRRSVMVWGLFI